MCNIFIFVSAWYMVIITSSLQSSAHVQQNNETSLDLTSNSISHPLNFDRGPLSSNKPDVEIKGLEGTRNLPASYQTQSFPSLNVSVQSTLLQSSVTLSVLYPILQPGPNQPDPVGPNQTNMDELHESRLFKETGEEQDITEAIRGSNISEEIQYEDVREDASSPKEMIKYGLLIKA